MATKKLKGLGMGLEALLGPKVQDKAPGTSDENALPVSLALDDLVAGQYQPRTRMDEGALYELAESIKAQGIMQPLLVRQLSSEQAQAAQPARGARPLYEIIAGERRFRAARLAGLDAQGLQRLIKEFGLTHEAAAQSVGRSRSAASNLMRLLQLAEPVQAMLMAGDLDMGHARALLALDKATQISAANQIVGKKMSVREAESLVKKLGAEFTLTSAKPKKEKSRDLKRLEEELSDTLAAEVEIRIKKRVKRNGRMDDMGEIVIQFGSLDALNGLVERLSPQTER